MILNLKYQVLKGSEDFTKYSQTTYNSGNRILDYIVNTSMEYIKPHCMIL